MSACVKTSPAIAAIASCPGFWSCQARAAGNGLAVLHFVAAPRGAGSACRLAFGPPYVAGRDRRDLETEVPT